MGEQQDGPLPTREGMVGHPAREVKWKMAYDVTLSMREIEKGKTIIDARELVSRINRNLPPKLKDLPFRVDMASQDPRPVNPLMMGERQIHVFNPRPAKWKRSRSRISSTISPRAWSSAGSLP